MSAICGIFNRKNGSIDKKYLSKMLKILKHRGPDGQSVLHDRSIGLGSRKLEFGHKEDNGGTASNEDESIFAFIDGPVFNYSQLKNKLQAKGHKFSTRGREELLTHLYEEFGTGFPKLLDGDFTAALWNSQKKELILCKDIASHKNIYYTFVNGRFIFSSEMKSLLLYPDVERDLDFTSIKEYLAMLHLLPPNTMLKKIKRLPPASKLVVTKDKAYKKNYWKINLNENKGGTEDYFAKKLDSLMEKSIKKRLSCCDDFGLFLSGGIDSTSILYYLDKYSQNPVDTYTIGLEKDSKYSRIASKHFESNHHEIEVSSEDIVKIAPQSIWHIEMPRTVGFFLYLLPKLSQEKKYVFFGEGAEEVFCGRNDHVFLQKLGKIRSKMPTSLRKRLRFLEGIPHRMVRRIIKSITRNFYSFYVNYRDRFTNLEWRKLFTQKVLKNNLPKKLKRSIDTELCDNFLKNFTYADLFVWFYSQPYFSIEQEVGNPYIDKNLLEFSFSIPPNLKVKNGTVKYFQKKIMKNRIPDEIIFREWQPWDSQETWAEEQTDVLKYYINKLKNRDVIKNNFQNLSKFIEKNTKYPEDHKLWNLFTLEIFCQTFIDNKDLSKPSQLKI